MSADISVAVITGRLGRDAEMSYISSGTALAKFSLAVNRSRKNASGEWTEEVSWFDFEMWGKRAEGLYQYLTKGLKVTVQCEIRQDRWEDKSGGGKRSKVKFVVNSLVFAGDKQSNGHAGGRAQQKSGGYDPAAEFNENVDDGGFEDDPIPFNLGLFVVVSHRGAYENMQRLWTKIAGGSVLSAPANERRAA